MEFETNDPATDPSSESSSQIGRSVAECAIAIAIVALGCGRCGSGGILAVAEVLVQILHLLVLDLAQQGPLDSDPIETPV